MGGSGIAVLLPTRVSVNLAITDYLRSKRQHSLLQSGPKCHSINLDLALRMKQANIFLNLFFPMESPGLLIIPCFSILVSEKAYNCCGSGSK